MTSRDQLGSLLGSCQLRRVSGDLSWIPQGLYLFTIILEGHPAFACAIAGDAKRTHADAVSAAVGRCALTRGLDAPSDFLQEYRRRCLEACLSHRISINGQIIS